VVNPTEVVAMVRTTPPPDRGKPDSNDGDDDDDGDDDHPHAAKYDGQPCSDRESAPVRSSA
jgi:hypothetical protein